MRPRVTVTRSWVKYRPLTLPTAATLKPVVALRSAGAPSRRSTSASNSTAVSARLTWGRWATQRRGGVPELQQPGQPEQVVPVPGDQVEVGLAGQQRPRE